MSVNLEEISPGVRDLVADLNAKGYITTDSGDGSNLAEGMGCALPFRHVFGLVPDEIVDVKSYVCHLASQYPDARVELTFSPGEPAIWMLMPDGLNLDHAMPLHGLPDGCDEDPAES
jgi:hypothetical protein